MRPNKVKLIFTDLDGTLLDHDTYDWLPASEALTLAKNLSIPVIPCTSKTLSECVALQSQLKLSGPAIFESGAGIALPKNEFDRPQKHLRLELSQHWICGFGVDYDSICEKLKYITKYGRFVFKGFSDMTVAEVASTTSMPEEKAILAKKRLFSEPIIWLDDAKSFNRFHKEIREAELSLTRGGRFIHVLGACDKGKAVDWLARRYDPTGRLGTWTIALGDSPNDVPMLQIANIAVIVKHPHRGALEYTSPNKQRLIRTTLTGPAGWNEAVVALLATAAAQTTEQR